MRSTNEELEDTNEELRRQTDEAVGYRSQMEAVFSSIDAGVVVLDRDLTVRGWNRWASQNIWGLRAEEGAWPQPAGPGLRIAGAAPARARSASCSRQPGSECELALDAIDRRGRAIACRVHLSPLLYPTSRCAGVVLIFGEAASPQS